MRAYRIVNKEQITFSKYDLLLKPIRITVGAKEALIIKAFLRRAGIRRRYGCR